MYLFICLFSIYELDTAWSWSYTRERNSLAPHIPGAYNGTEIHVFQKASFP